LLSLLFLLALPSGVIFRYCPASAGTYLMVGNVENQTSLIGLQSFRGDERFVTRAVTHQSTVLYLWIEEGFRMMQSLHTVDNRCAEEAESSGRRSQWRLPTKTNR
jgi:hypothetical protein